MQTEPIAGGFGMRVRGAPLAALLSNPSAQAALRELLAHHRAVVLSDLVLEAEALVALAGCLGTPRRARVGHPSIRPPANEFVFVGARRATPQTPPTRADAAHQWHLDYSTSATIPALSLMYAVEAPKPSSRTGFADMSAVYAALPGPLRARISGLQARHYAHPQGVDVLEPELEVVLGRAEREQGVAHALVMHDARRIPFLCLPPRDDSPVVGLRDEDGRALLGALRSHVERHGQPWEYEQAPGELLIWDNRVLLHKRSAWPSDKERLIWFVSTL